MYPLSLSTESGWFSSPDWDIAAHNFEKAGLLKMQSIPVDFFFFSSLYSKGTWMCVSTCMLLSFRLLEARSCWGRVVQTMFLWLQWNYDPWFFFFCCLFSRQFSLFENSTSPGIQGCSGLWSGYPSLPKSLKGHGLCNKVLETRSTRIEEQKRWGKYIYIFSTSFSLTLNNAVVHHANSSIYMAGRALENAGNVALQNLREPEQAAALFQEASLLYLQNSTPDRAAEMLEKSAK